MKAVLAKTSTDQHKSKIQNTETQLLCVEVYCSMQELAKILEEYDGEVFEIEVKR